MASTQARPIVEGGLLAAVSVAIALVSIYVPYANLIWPLPIALLGARHGVRWGVMSAVVGAMAVGAVANGLEGLFLLLGSGPVGSVMGACFRRDMSAERLLLIGTVSAVVSNLLLIGAAMFVLQGDFLQMIADMRSHVVSAVTEFGQMMNDGAMTSEQLAVMGEKITDEYMMMIPSALVLYSMFTVVLNFMLITPILYRMRMEVPSFRPFESWRMPGWVLYLFVLSLVGIYWGDKWSLDPMVILSENVRIFMSLALFVHGLALVRYAANRNRLLGRLYWVIVILMFLFPVFNIMMIVLGGLDILMDYRKKHEKRV